MKKQRIPISQQREYVILLLDIVKAMKYGSEFNEFGKNIIYSPSQINKLTQRSFTTATRETAQKLQRFCGIIWAYTEAIAFRAHDLTKEIHGQYQKEGIFSNLVVRQYLNLNECIIWDN